MLVRQLSLFLSVLLVEGAVPSTTIIVPAVKSEREEEVVATCKSCLGRGQEFCGRGRTCNSTGPCVSTCCGHRFCDYVRPGVGDPAAVCSSFVTDKLPTVDRCAHFPNNALSCECELKNWALGKIFVAAPQAPAIRKLSRKPSQDGGDHLRAMDCTTDFLVWEAWTPVKKKVLLQNSAIGLQQGV
jgi:hypothetical protein